MTRTTAHSEKEHLDRGRDALTPDDVLNAASEIIATEGLDALTMRHLAGRLGVTTPTIYWHIGNKTAIHERLLERFALEIGEIRARGETPKERIKSVVVELRKEVTERPQVAALAQSLGVTGSIYAAANVELLRELKAAGVTPAGIAPAMRSLLTYFASFFVLESQLANTDMEVSFSGIAEAGSNVAELPSTVVTELADPVDFDDTFDFTLDAIVDSILRR
jgi:TetR/AcrR family tetracycline transcriptional repressor